MLLHFFSFHTNQKFYEVYYTAALPFKFFDEMIYKGSFQKVFRECVSTGAAGARTRRSLGHHLLHPLIFRLLVLCAPTDFEGHITKSSGSFSVDMFLKLILQSFSLLSQRYLRIWTKNCKGSRFNGNSGKCWLSSLS